MGPFATLAKNALFKLDAENAHRLAIAAIKTADKCHLLPFYPNNHHPQLAQKVAGLDFPNPVGVAAGFDKNCEVPDAMIKLGFGFAEFGTTTPLAQDGNPRPRIFRLRDDHAIINRLGFNNKGHAFAIGQLKTRKASQKAANIIGANIGANKNAKDFISDYELGLKTFWHDADYFTLNVSSPNTPGLRDLQIGKTLGEFLQRVAALRNDLITSRQNSPAIFLKIAPDLNEIQIDEIAKSILASSIDGLVISNTTTSRSSIFSSSDESGGLSGQPLFERATIILAKMRQRLGPQMPIIGVGGINNSKTALDKLEAGADLLQLYTGMVYQGMTIANEICQGLVEKLGPSDHISSLSGVKTSEWAARKLPPQ